MSFVRLLLSFIVASLALFVVVGGALAATTSIRITADYSSSAPGLMFFTGTNPLCASGTFTANWQADTLGTVRAPVLDVFSGHVNNTAWNHVPTARWSGTDTYACSDGSGSFVIDWSGVGRVFEGSGVFGTFRIVSGTGAYAALRGEGSLWYIIYPAGGPHLELSGTVRY